MDFDEAELSEIAQSLSTFVQGLRQAMIEADRNDPNFIWAENFLGKDFYAPSNTTFNINISNSIDTVAAGGVVSNTSVGQQINAPNFSGHGQYSNTQSETSGHIPQRTQLEELAFLKTQVQQHQLIISELQDQLNLAESRSNRPQPLNKVEVRMVPQVYQASPSAEVYDTDMHAANAEHSSVQFEPTQMEDDTFALMRQHTKQCDQRSIDDTEVIVVDADEEHQLKESSSSKPNNSRHSRGSSRNLQIRANIDKEIVNVSQGKRFMRGESSIEIRDAPRDKKNTGLKPYTCKVCYRSFDFKCRLSQHLLVHTGEKPFTCDVCDKSFSLKCNLTKHLLIHTREKPYACDSCNKSFNQKIHLTTHLLIHTGGKSYTCDVCEKSFRQKINLASHLLIHTDEKPFVCDICNSSFRQKNHISDHMRIHTGEKPFACKVCNKAFRQKCNLSTHSKIHRKSN